MGLAFSPVRPRVCSAKRTRFFSLWLTARTTNCPSTLKKGTSQSKSLLNDRVRSLFGRSLNRSFRLSNNTRLFFSVLCPDGLSLFPANPFRPSRSLVFQQRAFAVCFRLSPCRSYRRFVSPRRPTCPHPAACRLRPTLRIVVSPVRAPSVCLVALSPLCPDVYTPQWFCFSNDYPARSVPSARRYPCQTNKSFSSPYVFNRATSIFSHSVRLALRRCIAAHETASHPRLASK